MILPPPTDFLPNYLSAIIKGDFATAQAEARKRGIFQVEERETFRVGLRPNCAIYVRETAENIRKLSAWFTEPGTAPFPEGTCLHYCYHRDGE